MTNVFLNGKQEQNYSKYKYLKQKLLMANKKKVTEKVTIVEFNPYSKEKYDELITIMRTPLPTKEQKDNILKNYQLYIDPKQTKYSESCNSCSGSIANLFGKLRNYLNANVDKFDKE